MRKMIRLAAFIPALAYTWLWSFWTGIAFLQPPYPHNIKPMAWFLIIGQTYVGVILLVIFVKEVRSKPTVPATSRDLPPNPVG